jgi:phage terminase large subunit-like protein
MIAATADDARDIMVEGESGILAICPRDERPEYRASMRRLEWPNGARTLIFTADEPERLRGKQHMRLWADELAAWRYPEAWDQAMFGLRLGADPRSVVTTTPKPVELVRRLIADPTTAVTRGSTYENRGNLAPAFFDQIIRRYEGTRIGRQELNAEILDDIEGALWTHATIDNARVQEHPDLVRIGVGVDPSGGTGENHDEQGIIIAASGVDGDGYVLADYSCKLSPDGWGRRTVQAFIDYKADVVFVEKNYGGDMAIATIQAAARAMSATVPIVPVSASRGKVVRAEPIAALYEQGRVHHVGTLEKLEDQMCTYVPGLSSASPDRMDALVWVATEVLLQTPIGVWSL